MKVRLYCKACKAVILRDKDDYERYRNKRGYKSYCENKGRNVYLKLEKCAYSSTSITFG